MIKLYICIAFYLGYLIAFLPSIFEGRKEARRIQERTAEAESRWQAWLRREEEKREQARVAYEKGLMKVTAREARKARVRRELEARTEANRLKREMKGADGEPDAPDIEGHHHFSRYYG